MPRRTTRRQLDSFLRHLAATGNFALAAESARLAKSGLYKRRARDPAFAARCEVALAAGRLRSSPGRGRGAQDVRGTSEHRRAQLGGPFAEERMVEGAHRRRGALLTTPGTLILHRAGRRSQLRRSPAGRLTQTGIETFLRTLAATANVRFAANSVGVAHSSIYARRRTDPAFAAAMREALEIGYDLLEQAVLQSAIAALETDFLPSTSGEGNRGGEQANGLDAQEPVVEDSPFAELDLSRPPEHPRPGTKPSTGLTLTIERALWLLKLRRDLRLPEGWRYAPKGYQPNARDRMTDQEVRAELERRIQALARTEPGK